MGTIRKLLVSSAMGVLLVTAVAPGPAAAQPGAPQVVPDRVGSIGGAREGICDKGGFPLIHPVSEFIWWFAAQSDCHTPLDDIDTAFDNAYLRAEGELVSPGFPTNDIHGWQGVSIQDFSGSGWGDGWGAIIAPSLVEEVPEPQQPHYVGGGTWVAYKRAVWEQGIQPGYPINLEHQWDGVTIQDFRGGSWGDAAIIGGPDAWLVAGRHWQAYVIADGSNRLGNPLGPVYETDDGRYQQSFAGGTITELAGQIEVEYYDTGEILSFSV